MERPDLCKECKKHCCTKPALTTAEYITMNQYIANDELRKAGPFYRAEEELWAFKANICPMLGPHGCIVSHEHKPLMCKLFPFAPIRVYSDKKEEAVPELVLLVSKCPQWKAFGDNYETARKELENG